MTKRIKTEYSTEFKERAVSMVISSDKSTAQIAKDLGVMESTLYTWLNKVKQVDVQNIGQTNEQIFDELKRLKKSLLRTKSNDIF